MLHTQSVAEFTKSKGFVSVVPKIRANKNGYPYVTMITKDNVAENIYFSKKSSIGVKADMPIVKGFLSTFQVAETTNEAGELRTKLISNSERADISDLL
jgi:hypothetical protein